MTRELPGDGPDTALARLLHSTQRLSLEVLRPLLDGARAGGVGLGESLLAQRLLSPEELATYRGRLNGPVGRLGPGEVVAGDYRVESLLGQGGMGAVYRAQEVATGRALALKILLPELAEDVDVRRFQVEGELGARIGGLEGFVPVHAAGLHRGLPYLAMGLVQGGDLEDRIDALDPESLAGLVAVTARALHAAHLVGVVHRDLKPANILIDERGQPLVADLGLARGGLTCALTQSGEILGTPSYMAPEQVSDPRSVDARSDVYALGAILYRGLSGAPPFQGPLLQVLDHVLTRAPLPLSSQIPSDLSAICLRALAKDPARRYPTGAALAEDLERFVRGEPLEGARSSGQRRGLLAVLLVVCGLFFSAALWAWPGQRQAAPSRPDSADRRSLERERVQSRFESELLALARGRRGVLEPIRERAVRSGLDPEAIERAALEEVRSDCARLLVEAEHPARRFGEFKAKLSPGGRGGPALRALAEDMFSSLVAGDRPRWLEVARLSRAIRPDLAPASVKRAAKMAFRKAHAGLKIPPPLALACLQLDVTLRAVGPLLYQRSLIPGEVADETLESGSATRAFLKLMNGAPTGATDVNGLPPPDFQRFFELVRRARSAPVRDLGQQYTWEVELLWLRCQERQREPTEQLLEQVTELRRAIAKSGNPALLYEAIFLERAFLPAKRLPGLIDLEEQLVEVCLRQEVSHPNAERDRNQVLARSVENLARDLLLFEKWEEARDLFRRFDPEIFLPQDLGHVKVRHVETVRLCRAWSVLKDDPRETIKELGGLPSSSLKNLRAERTCAQLLLARAQLALGERAEARLTLGRLRTLPTGIHESWWVWLSKSRDQLLEELERR